MDLDVMVDKALTEKNGSANKLFLYEKFNRYEIIMCTIYFLLESRPPPPDL